MPVYARMRKDELYDFVLLSVVDALLKEVYVRCGTQKREGRIEAMQNALETLQETYKGYIDDAPMNRMKKFLVNLHFDIDKLCDDIKVNKE
jgi:hypothetical protein